jgi:hypothetical protein
MRSVAVILGCVCLASAGAAAAATPDSVLSRQALFNAANATPAAGVAASGLNLGQADRGLVRFSTGEASVGGDGTYIDSIRISTADYGSRPGAALLRPNDLGGANSQGLDLAYIRNWPQALSLDAGRLTMDVTPHAGFGVLAGGARTAEAGALVKLQQKMLRAAGMTGQSDPGHLFLFAGATERTVNLNAPHTQAAMGPDPEDGFISEAQAGVGFQRGVFQASFGFSHQSMRLDSLGDESRIDNRVGLRISIH